MDYTVFDGLDELCHHAKFGEGRIHRAPAVGAKTCCVYVFFLSRSKAGSLLVRR